MCKGPRYDEQSKASRCVRACRSKGLVWCCADDTGRGAQGLTIRFPWPAGQRLAVGCDRARDRGRLSSRLIDCVCDITVVPVAADYLRGCGLPCLVGAEVRESHETPALSLLHTRGSAVIFT